jgi:hypothetical protein
MPGIRDRNLRSGDLHEQLGLFLLRAVALVAPVPRQEDVGNDAVATLIRPEGSRRLIPDLSFFIQLKAESKASVRYDSLEAVAWLRELEMPLFIGRVSLPRGKIELFSTQRLHQILLEQPYEGIELLLDRTDESDPNPKFRRANLGPPVLEWSVADVSRPDLIDFAFEVLRPHVESLRQNRALRTIQMHHPLNWQTGKPPSGVGTMMQTSAQSEIGDTLNGMAPHVCRLMMEISQTKRYSDFPLVAAFMEMMARWGVNPDPSGMWRKVVGLMAEGPEISVEEAIVIRYASHPALLDLNHLPVTDEAAAAIPREVTGLAMVDTQITDAGIRNLLRLTGLRRINLAGTKVTDDGLLALASLKEIKWVCLHRTQVTADGVSQFKAIHPNAEVLLNSEP